MVSLAKKTATFAHSLIVFMRGKKKRVPQEVIDTRFEICQDCDSFVGNACEECGCCISGERVLLNKLTFPDEKCPLDKWPVHVPEKVEEDSVPDTGQSTVESPQTDDESTTDKSSSPNTDEPDEST